MQTFIIHEDNGNKSWLQDWKMHRDEKDPATGLILHAYEGRGTKVWFHRGEQHRDEKDLNKPWCTLPAVVRNKGKSLKWMLKGRCHRSDIDPDTNLILPAVMKNKTLEWWNNGLRHRSDIDPNTGLTLPAVIRTIGNILIQQWWINGKHIRNDKDKYGVKLPRTVKTLKSES